MNEPEKLRQIADELDNSDDAIWDWVYNSEHGKWLEECHPQVHESLLKALGLKD